MKNPMVTIQAKILVGILTAVLAALAVYAKVPAKLTVPQALGALAGPDIPFPYLRWGGVGPIWHFSESPVATSSVFCSIAYPAGTSTPIFISWRPDSVGTIGTQTFDISTSSVQFQGSNPSNAASSTPAFVIAASLASSQMWFPTASSTPGVGILGNPQNLTGNMGTFLTYSSSTAPIYLNFRIASGTPGVFATYLSGNCQVEFLQL